MALDIRIQQRPPDIEGLIRKTEVKDAAVEEDSIARR
eukprot:CAMPEP_0185758370 /NCGR_PEP_ID=MMETSP1174-20130828/17021_1 /TAXON_ID=35687 /ORGANISM="Dictyocha speculum, Strain CCMP1381" /LENGTH=36 /DNA_ID= /DNA_START= /DNA_END= /DNA_ORIENTATION=